MKKLTLLLCLLLLTSVAMAQLLFNGEVKGAKAGETIKVNLPFDAWYIPKNTQEVHLDAKGSFSVQLAVERPQTFFFEYKGKRVYLYAEPGETLSLQATAPDMLQTLKFSGSLGPENEFWKELGLTYRKLYPELGKNAATAPKAMLAAMQQNQQLSLQKLAKLRIKASADYKRVTRGDIQYFPASKMFDLFFENEGKPNQGSQLKEEWREALVLAYESQPLSNEQAVNSYHYQAMVGYYPMYLEQRGAGKDAYQKTVESIFGKPLEEIEKELAEKGGRYWEYRAFQYGLQGKALEYALASFISNGISNGQLDYLQEAYDTFQQQYPNSSYRQHLERQMQPYLASLAKADVAGIEFAPDSVMYKQLEDIAKQHEGRVVYVDLWGTWCGPCRDEFAYNKELKERFKGKPVDFVYVAVEHSPNPEKRWRETIKFYNLTGQHVLAGQDLVQYFRDLYGKNGSLLFPSYLLLDKSGKLVTKQAERPSAREKLFVQIEGLLEK